MADAIDQDLEQLEMLLDGELSPAEEDELHARLEAQPQLREALHALRRDREMRQALFASLEPAQTDPSVRRLMSAVRRETTRDLAWGERTRRLRWVTGVAACLLVGFLSGYGYRGGGVSNTAGFGSVGTISTSVSSPAGASSLVTNTTPGQINFPGLKVSDWEKMRSMAANTNTQLPGYVVSLTDESGNVIGVQRFSTLQEANDFANDVARWRAQHNQLRNGGARLVGDQF